MAIDDLLDEHEQSERVLQWLRNNGAALFGGILLGLAAIGGWKWWQHREAEQRLTFSTRYQQAVDAIAAKDKQAAAKVAALGDSVYRPLAALQLAKAQVEAGERDAAIATLRGVRSEDPALQALVEQRLARLLIDAKQADAALKLVANASTPAAFEIQGDAQYALGRRDQARAAYEQALTRLDVASPQRRVLELKLTEVGGTPAKPEAKS